MALEACMRDRDASSAEREMIYVTRQRLAVAQPEMSLGFLSLQSAGRPSRNFTVARKALLCQNNRKRRSMRPERRCREE